MNKENYEVLIYNSIDAELSIFWNNFCIKYSNYIFQDLYFIQNYLKFKKKNFDEIKIFVVRHKPSKKIIAIFPFEIRNLFGFKVLNWIGNQDFDYFCPILISDDEFKLDFCKLWDLVLNKIDNCDVIFLTKQAPQIDDCNNPITEKLINIFKHSKVFNLKLSKNFKEYISSINNKKFINEFLRTKKKLLSLNKKIEFKVIESNDPSLKVNQIIKKKISHLKKLKKKVIFNDEISAFFDFLKIDKKITLLAGIYIDNILVSASFNFVYKNRLYYFMPVILNNDFNKFSPGKLLIYQLIEWSYANNYRTFDFGLGEENYKKYWSNDSLQLYDYLNYKTKKGIVLFFIFRLIKFIKLLKK